MTRRLEQLALSMPHPARVLISNLMSWRLNRLRSGGTSTAIQQRHRIGTCFDMTWAEACVEQDRLASQLIEQAITYVPYYRDRAAQLPAVATVDDLKEWPLLSKAEARAAGVRLFHDVLINKPHYTGHTSGSTGTPFRFKLTLEALRIRFAWRDSFYAFHGFDFGSEYNIRMGGRLFVPVTRTTPPFWIVDRVTKQIMFSNYHISDTALRAFIPVLQQKHPGFITGYPSAIYTLAKFCLREDVMLPLRAAFSDSETLLNYQRETIREAWGCEVYDYYGVEAGLLAGQCTEGYYHLSPLTNIVEIVNDAGQPTAPGEIGEIIATDLTNPLMPLIRYRTGDTAAWSQTTCMCGWNTPVIEQIEGRVDDIVTLPSGRKVGRLDHIFKHASNIRECQIIQEKPDQFTFLIVPDENYTRDVEQNILAEAHARLGEDVVITVKHVDAVERTSRGKFRSVISRVNTET